MKYGIEPGIIISKLDLKDGDNIIITIDPDMWGPEVTPEIGEMVQRMFPNNKIVVTVKGIEIDAADGPSPKED